MRFKKLRKSIAALLAMTMLVAMMLAVSASDSSGGFPNTPQDVYVEAVEGGNLFAQNTDDCDTIGIVTNDAEHTISISIVYSGQSNVVYQWSIKDYPVREFSPDDLDFWNDIILYAEDKMDQAERFDVPFTVTTEDDPMPSSSANADLMEDLEDIVGIPYDNKYTYQSRRMDGHDYKLYESMSFNIKFIGSSTIAEGLSVTSYLASVLSIVATAPNVALVAGVLGLALALGSDLMPAGKTNKYSCMVLYHRYVTVDGGSYHYADAYKIRSFSGLEDANPNSRGRAHVFPDTEELYYDLNQSAEFFNSGIFDAAYREYNYN